MRRQIFLTAILIAMVFKTGSGQASGSIHETEDYPFGFKTDTVTFDAARDTYNKWKERYLVKCNDDFRVICEGRDETRVEAIGFGMILTAYFADKDEFDGLYRFYQNKRTENANYMMAWNVSCDSINDPGSATDGDIDVAFALIVASGQWGGNYFEEAVNVIEVIKNSVVTTCDSLLALAPGYSVESDIGPMWGGCDLTDIQYYTPAFFRIFAEVSGDNDWSKLADDTYTILHAAAHPETGLVPDWQSVSGVPGGNSDRIAYYRYDACRVPWRMALDYLWNGNPYAREWCTKVSDWAYGIGPANIR
ncbi:MAG: glycosyl hydrolase family 8, partial [Bacteroidales bacterium]